MSEYERDRKIDIIKGIGILLMVLCHAGFKYSNFVYLFHMALFFVAAGYCYHVKYSQNLDNVWELFVKRLKSLWLPYVVFNSIFVFLNNIFIRMNIYTSNEKFLDTPQGVYAGLHNYLGIDEMFNTIMKCISFDYMPQIAGASWFLRILFLVTMLYCCIDYIVQKTYKLNKTLPSILQIIISTALLVIGYQCKIQGKPLMYSMELVFAVYFIFCFGYFFNKYNISRIFKIPIVFVLIAFFILYQCNKVGFVSLVMCEYTNPRFFIIVSLTGWIFVYGIACYLEKCRLLASIFEYIGKNSLIILFFHFLSFKLLNYLQVIIYTKPKFMMAAFPTLINDGVWCYIYTLVGIIIPLLLHKMFSIVKDYYNNKVMKKQILDL